MEATDDKLHEDKLHEDKLHEDKPFPIREGFVADTAEKCDWVLDKIATAKSRAKRIAENAAEMIKEAEKEAEYFEARFRPDLEVFARAEIAKNGGKTKTVKLLCGALALRIIPANIVLAETGSSRTEAISWARENMPEAVSEVVTVKLDMALLKETLLIGTDASGIEARVFNSVTGEVVDWAAVKMAEERLYIK